MSSLFIVVSIVVLLFSLIISLIAFFFALKKEKTEDQNFDFKHLFKIYLVSINIICILVIAAGLMQVIRPVTSYIFGFEFSYQVNPFYDRTADYYGPAATFPDSDIVSISGQKYYADLSVQRNDLLVGFTVLITSLSILIIHWIIGFIYFRNRKLSTTILNFFSKVKNFTLVAVFSLTALISIPTAIYEILSFLTSDRLRYLSTYRGNYPGDVLGVAVVSSILWIIFLLLTVSKRETKAPQM
jgi:hypothetical protein